jgi:DNA (cytosine-5)-methyltransferase 1
MTIKYIDLFSGIGGFHIALDKIKNTKCVFASEIDKNAQKVYELNFDIKPHGDITKIKPKNIPDHDLLVGGFPCQSFSVSGKKLGLNDNRGTLFDNIIDILKIKKPKFSILENVKNIKTIDNGTVYKYIYDKLNKIGYNVFDIILNPTYFGIPQNRVMSCYFIN